MAELVGGTTIGGYLALHSGMKDLPVGGDLTVKGRIYMGVGNTTGGIFGRLGMSILVDHNNGNVTISATGGDLYLGYTNTNKIRLIQPLFDNDGTIKIIEGADGTLYYRGEDTDTRYLNKTTDTFTGSLVAGNRQAGIYGTYDSTKIDHIWSMGVGYKVEVNGANFGNLYGLAYKHTNNTTGGTMADSHQILAVGGGTANVALGMSTGNIWAAGRLTLAGSSTAPSYLTSQTDGSLRVHNSSGYIEIGPKNTSYCHVYTDRGSFYLNKDIITDGSIYAKGQPYLYAGQSTALTVPSASWTILQASVAATNNVGGGTWSGGRYTVPETGKYLINQNTSCATTTGAIYYLAAYINGALSNANRMDTRQASAGSDGMQAGTTVIAANAGDVLDVRFYTSASGGATVSHAYVSIVKLPG